MVMVTALTKRQTGFGSFCDTHCIAATLVKNAAFLLNPNSSYNTAAELYRWIWY